MVKLNVKSIIKFNILIKFALKTFFGLRENERKEKKNRKEKRKENYFLLCGWGKIEGKESECKLCNLICAVPSIGDLQVVPKSLSKTILLDDVLPKTLNTSKKYYG